MLDALLALFRPKPPFAHACSACDAHRGTIEVLKEQVNFLQQQISTLEDALMKATRLTPIAQNQAKGGEPVATMPPSWDVIRRKLEEKHRRKPETHEDQVASHWENKIQEMEGNAGFKTP